LLTPWSHYSTTVRKPEETAVLPAACVQRTIGVSAMQSTTTEQSDVRRGYPIAVASAAILSTTAIIIRHLTQTYQIPALVLAFWRDSLVALIMLLILRVLDRRLLKVTKPQLRYLGLYGLVLALFNSTWTLSVAVNGAAVSTVLVYSSAGFTVVLGWWLLKERLGVIKVLAAAASLAGCLLISDVLRLESWLVNPVGILTGLFSGLLYAIYSVMGRSASQRGLNPWTTLLYTFGSAAILLLSFNLLPGAWLPGSANSPADMLWLGDSVAGWGLLFLLAAGPTLAGFGLYNVSLGYLPSSVANLVLSLEPAFTAVIAYFVLGERLTMTQLGGSLLILIGVVLLRMQEGLRKSSDNRKRPWKSARTDGARARR
jgi:drug/metabolite transporter (DMT)-like permease